ncbi:MAG TPA: hypothetical protein VGA91_07135 [Candidatus Limnocylindria bacterium]
MSRRRGRRSRRPLAALAALGAALTPTAVAAHALGSSFPLPVPLWLYLAGAAIAVAASFIVSVVVIKPPADPPRYPVRPVSDRVARAGGIGLRVIGLVWWYGAIAAGWLIGGITFLPAVLFWIGIWVGVPMLAAILGNPWPALSPFRTTYDLLDGLVQRATGGRRLDLGLSLPRLGRGPAVIVLFIFLILELVWPDRLNPIPLATLLTAYTGLTLAGMMVFGNVAWLRSFELFEILNGWFGRVGPFGRRTRRTQLCADCSETCNPGHCVDCAECVAAGERGDQRVELRWWFTGLTETARAGWGDAAFILLALAGVTFDGLQETSLGGGVLTILFPPLAEAFSPLAASYLAPTAMLAGVFGVFMLAFAVAAWLTRLIGEAAGGGEARISLGRVAGTYAPTLLPIAAGYLVAHYLTLVIQGAAWLPLLLIDPLALTPLLDFIPTAFIWYLSVGAIVGGHIAAVVLAHRLALRDQAWRPILAGLPLVVLMIGYTVLSLWIIAQPIVIEPA